MSYNLTVIKSDRIDTYKCNQGSNLLNVLLDMDYDINAYCGGKGTCGKCKVKIISGSTEVTSQEKELLSDEQIEAGIRLACKTEIKDDLKIQLPESDNIEVLTESILNDSNIDPGFKKFKIQIEKSSLEDQRSYLKKIYDRLSLSRINIKALKDLDNLNKESLITVTVNSDNEIVQVETGDTIRDLYGIAVDIGTTTIVIYLVDLNTGKQVDTYSLYNPQKRYGADVISRINYTIENEEGTKKLKEDLIKGLNQGINQLQLDNAIKREDIYKIAIAGNTVMLHTLLGMKVKSIANSPYVPLFTEELSLKPEKINLEINPEGIIEILPSISGYIGADIVGDMIAVNHNSEEKNINLIIDLGTNGEIVLDLGDKIYACSTAAGPALEGAKITHGMAGIPGAISRFKLNGKVEYDTIKNKKPEGICGSGLLDIISELYLHQIINSRGSFVSSKEIPEEYRERLTSYRDMEAFIISENNNKGNNIVLTQKDIREVQLAKGAIQAGIEILLNEKNIKYEEIDNVYLAGGFGNYIDPHSACSINLIPEELKDKVKQIGNGAGTGAKMYLIDKAVKTFAKKLKNRVEYIELSKSQDFQTKFMETMEF
ncbi:MAG: ASKHA domain-containing protein [Halanaerobiales bacterium]